MGFNMKAIVAQKLLPTILDKPKRVPITEIMIFNGTIRKLILEEQDEKLPAAIRIGKQASRDRVVRSSWPSTGTDQGTKSSCSRPSQ